MQAFAKRRQIVEAEMLGPGSCARRYTMEFPMRLARAVASSAALAILAACVSDSTTPPQVKQRAIGASPGSAVLSTSGALPSGETQVGKSLIEPAYDDVSGRIIYLLTPLGAPFPSNVNDRASAPLYLVEYPPGSTVGTLNCTGVPGNCPDHNGIVAGVATSIMPSVYGTDPAAVPGHDHLVAAPASGGDFNIAWEVVEILFTNKAAANTHLTTKAAIDAAVARGDVIALDLGFAFHCSVTPSAAYLSGTPVG
jgi:hypothetical protein